MSPTARTKRRLELEGYRCGVVERFVPAPHLDGPGIRKDLFGFIDMIAIGHGKIIGVQCCAGSGHANHVTKILGLREPAIDWLDAGGLILLQSWRKYKEAVERKYWRPRDQWFDRQSFELPY